MPKSLTRWEVTRLKRWEATRKKKGKFLLVYGLFAFGLPMFVIAILMLGYRRLYNDPTLILIHAFIWELLGLCYGWALWALNERRYQKLIAKRDAAQHT